MKYCKKRIDGDNAAFLNSQSVIHEILSIGRVCIDKDT